jgi:enoyl-CoA hydratase
MEYTVVLIDSPAPYVRRVTLNRPEKRNALNSVLRHEIVAAVREGETDPDVRVTIIAANGPSFCGGYDLTQNVTAPAPPAADYPYPGAGGFQRSVVDLWTSLWDLSKPVIAQVHGHCLAGGSELATGCDLVYVAEDARIGYPAVRFGTPDMQYHAWLVGMRRGMELMLTGDSMTGIEAADWGFANRAFPAGRLEAETLRIARRIATSPRTSCRSTSAPSTAPWITWACGRRCGPAPNCRSSTGTARAAGSSSTTSASLASPPP